MARLSSAKAATAVRIRSMPLKTSTFVGVFLLVLIQRFPRSVGALDASENLQRKVGGFLFYNAIRRFCLLNFFSNYYDIIRALRKGLLMTHLLEELDFQSAVFYLEFYPILPPLLLGRYLE